MLSLKSNEVHVWLAHCFDQRYDRQLMASYHALLNEQEVARQQRFRHVDDRQRYVVARALVRYTLSRYVALPPADWRFVLGEHDKPEIAHCPLPLRFNLSHSGQWAVCAVALRDDVGVDIECTQRTNDLRAIARHHFSASEWCRLQRLEGEGERDRFFDLWTLKEAFMKARGEGISLGLGNFSFDFIPAQSRAASINHIRVHFADVLDDDPSCWQFWLFSPHSDYRLALALHRGLGTGEAQVQCYHTVPGHSVDRISPLSRAATAPC